MTDFRALCAELVAASKMADWEEYEEIWARAEATLAQPEPVAPPRPECFDFAMDFLGDPEETEVRRYVEALEARAALLPEPVAPTDEDQPMPAAIRDMPEQQQRWYALGWRAVLARYARATIQPVAVSERLPGPEDCDAEGRCWWFVPGDEERPGAWYLDGQPPAREIRFYGNTHWLPHHALPTP
jgi:hypothetical protein